MGTPGNKGRKLGGRAAVIALAPVIREALAGGVHLSTVYEQHAAKLGISYTQFCKHVRNHITGSGRRDQTKPPLPDPATSQQMPDRHVSGEGSPSPSAQKSAASGPRTMGPRKLPEFHYDPMDAYRHRFPKKEE